MHIHKTGAPDPRNRSRSVRAARARSAPGAACAPSITTAKCVGLAYQVVDDVLDQESSTRDARQGPSARDAANNKPTYVSALGLVRAKALAGGIARGGGRPRCRNCAAAAKKGSPKLGRFHRAAQVLAAEKGGLGVGQALAGFAG